MPLTDVESALLALDEVEQVHDLHVWTLTSGLNALSAHLLVRGVDDPAESQRLLEQVSALLRERFGVEHTTIQLEYRDLRPDEPEY